jgi:hypothetical protein
MKIEFLIHSPDDRQKSIFRFVLVDKTLRNESISYQLCTICINVENIYQMNKSLL